MQKCCSVLPLIQKSFVLNRVTSVLLANHESLSWFQATKTKDEEDVMVIDEQLETLKWYYDQKVISFFSSDFESVFA